MYASYTVERGLAGWFFFILLSVLSVKRGGPFMGTHLLDGFGARSHARDVLFSLEYEVREEGGWPSSRTSYGMLKNIANHFTILNNLANFHLFVNTFWGG